MIIISFRLSYIVQWPVTLNLIILHVLIHERLYTRVYYYLPVALNNSNLQKINWQSFSKLQLYQKVNWFSLMNLKLRNNFKKLQLSNWNLELNLGKKIVSKKCQTWYDSLTWLYACFNYQYHCQCQKIFKCLDIDNVENFDYLTSLLLIFFFQALSINDIST